MKLSGHTMATPEQSLSEAIDFFAKLGLDGIEIIIQSDYKCAIPYNSDMSNILKIKKLVSDAGLQVSCVTPYYSSFNSLDTSVRNQEVCNMLKIIEVANLLEAPSIRTYGGSFKDDELDDSNEKLDALAEAMRICGNFAKEKGTTLVLENHFGTMTTTAKRTLEIVHHINHSNVRILYDQANLAFFPAEEYKTAIDLQKDFICHVHVKDLVYKKNVNSDFKSDNVWHISNDIRTVSSRIPGEGILDWQSILQCLKDYGYDGWLSLEYERRWGNQDLPIAAAGMPIATKTLRKYISNLT